MAQMMGAGGMGVNALAAIDPFQMALSAGGRGMGMGGRMGLELVGTASAGKHSVLEARGCEAIDYRSEDFAAITNDATGGDGANVIYDPVGGDTFDRSTKCIAWEGRILIIGFSGGRFGELRTNHALVKNYSVIGIHMDQYGRRDRPYLENVHEDLMRLLAAGKIDPMIHLEVGIEEAGRAIGDLADRKTTDKVIVHVAP